MENSSQTIAIKLRKLFFEVESQIGKLQEEPKLLEECNNIIREQEEAGIIEKVNELPSAQKVYYMPNQIVVREHARTCPTISFIGNQSIS